MKITRIFLLLLLCSFVTVTAAPPAVHWYQVFINGSSSKTLTGSSHFDPEQLAVKLNGADPIVLENLRDIFARSSDEPMRWHPDDSTVKAVIPTKSILYFTELPGDPAAPKK